MQFQLIPHVVWQVNSTYSVKMCTDLFEYLTLVCDTNLTRKVPISRHGRHDLITVKIGQLLGHKVIGQPLARSASINSKTFVGALGLLLVV
jgi:hypothetical protein